MGKRCGAALILALQLACGGSSRDLRPFSIHVICIHPGQCHFLVLKTIPLALFEAVELSASSEKKFGHILMATFLFKSLQDYLTGIISISVNIIWRFTGEFMAPEIVCKTVRYLQVVLLYASTYVLVSLSIDRYHAIVHPMKFLQGEKQAKVLIAVSWTLSFLFSIPTFIIFGKLKLPNGEMQCWALWPDDSYWTPYMTIVALLVYFIPLIIISVIYFIVIRTIWVKSKGHAVIISNYTDGNFCTSYSHRGLISKAKMKAIKYSIVVILAFILCWSPYFLFDILDNFEMLPETKERFYASVIIQHLPFLNSAINPIIYCVFSNSIFIYCRDRNSGKLGGTIRDKTEGIEMQVVSRPEYL
eukprot:XP_017950337.1 PREDICTED: neuropeptide S receptor [Xenopus tropicalis]